MIVGGLIFLGVIEGFGLLARYSADRSGSLQREMDTYNDLILLSGIFSQCDSLAFDQSVLTIYQDSIHTRFIATDEKLILNRGAYRDTLFSGRPASVVQQDRDKDDDKALPGIKLTVEIPGTEEPMIHLFHPELSRQVTRRRSIEETEQEYLYEQ